MTNEQFNAIKRRITLTGTPQEKFLLALLEESRNQVKELASSSHHWPDCASLDLSTIEENNCDCWLSEYCGSNVDCHGDPISH